MGDRGAIVYRPDDHHHVVTERRGEIGYGTLPFNHPAYFAQPRTVIACDCGRTFVAREWVPGECFPRWRREGWFERRRRERRVRKTLDHVS